MNIEDKVIYYYDKLLEIRNSFSFYKPVKSLSSNNYSIKKALRIVINANYDYLLTDSFLIYLMAISINRNVDTFRSRLYKNLVLLIDPKELLNICNDYFATISFGLSKHQVMPYDKSFHIISLKKIVKDEEKELYDSFEHSRVRLECDIDIDESEYFILKYVMQLIASYCLINKCSNNFFIYANPYLDNPIDKLEDLRMNGIYQELDYITDHGNEVLIDYDNLHNYVINNLENRNKIIIK